MRKDNECLTDWQKEMKRMRTRHFALGLALIYLMVFIFFDAKAYLKQKERIRQTNEVKQTCDITKDLIVDYLDAGAVPLLVCAYIDRMITPAELADLIQDREFIKNETDQFHIAVDLNLPYQELVRWDDQGLTPFDVCLFTRNSVNSPYVAREMKDTGKDLLGEFRELRSWHIPRSFWEDDMRRGLPLEKFFQRYYNYLKMNGEEHLKLVDVGFEEPGILRLISKQMEKSRSFLYVVCRLREIGVPTNKIVDYIDKGLLTADNWSTWRRNLGSDVEVILCWEKQISLDTAKQWKKAGYNMFVAVACLEKNISLKELQGSQEIAEQLKVAYEKASTGSIKYLWEE